MQITCPYCGTRDRREFTYQGSAEALNRPPEDAAPEVWDEYLHLRDNPCGETRDLWYHDPCGTWVNVKRNTATHEVYSSRAVKEVAE